MDKLLLLPLIGCLLCTTTSFAQEAPDRPPGLPDARVSYPIQFKPHTSQATIERTIIRGEYACYTFIARKGQRLDTTLDDGPEQNVYLSVFEPGYKPARNEITGVYGLTGKSLPGLDDGTEEKEAHTILPTSGKYIMCLTTGRGAGGHFKTVIQIR
ncbi:hypothetical protein [Acetobacter sp. DsW_063]|uniref:hypothetical protein n=1 Tax=Acetobacter sp. DsW_063 TaxID=1514894 RepID=UPI000A394064|nr:hypothetical protein [Acetobacter sp. DsW_063]OUJ14714.1 hypothetical protein HK28_11865 [Acetobacter sp. DsW_063]